MNYTYDGTFFGFMSAIFAAYAGGITSVGTIGESAETSLFGDCKYIPTEADKAGRVLTGLKNQCGEKAVYYLYYGFLSDIKGKEASLTTYIRRAFILKHDFYRRLQEAALWRVRNMARKTANERHALSGLLRFREFSDGMLYAPANPVCNIVPLLASHFAARLPKERWVIHDVNRHEGVFYD